MTNNHKNKKEMEQLGPCHYSIIYNHLPSIKDLANVALVCRKMCWLLWREDEQQSLWLPRVRKSLHGDKTLFNATTLDVIREIHLFRRLASKSRAEITDQFNNEIIPRVFAKIESHCINVSRHEPFRKIAIAKVKVIVPLLAKTNSYNLAQNTVDIVFDRGFNDMTIYKFVGEMTGDFKVYTLFGTVDENKTITSGDILINGKIFYNGGFKHGSPFGQGLLYTDGELTLRGNFDMGTPHGYATLYNKGFIKYEGEWIHGETHGQGTLYHDGKTAKLFVGQSIKGVCTNGMWLSEEGDIIHTGHVSFFSQMMEQRSSKHLCTYPATSKCHQLQEWYHCRTCYKDLNMGCCVACSYRCHKGHDLVKKPASTFFCDCGENSDTCCALVPANDDFVAPENDIPIDNTVDSDNDENEPAAQQEIAEEQVNQQVPADVDALRQRIEEARQNGDVQVFFEVDPESLAVIGMRFVPRENDNNNNEDEDDENNRQAQRRRLDDIEE